MKNNSKNGLIFANKKMKNLKSGLKKINKKENNLKKDYKKGDLMKKIVLVLSLILLGISNLSANMCRFKHGKPAGYLRCVQRGDHSARHCCHKLGGEWFRRKHERFEKEPRREREYKRERLVEPQYEEEEY